MYRIVRVSRKPVPRKLGKKKLTSKDIKTLYLVKIRSENLKNNYWKTHIS